MIEVKNITKTYQLGENTVHALKGVSLKIEQGDFVAIMGPSGSGKSTLAQILGLLDVPSSGVYTLHQKAVSSLDEDQLSELRRKEIGFIFQQFNLLPRMNAVENVALPLLYSKAEVEDGHAANLLNMVGLGPRLDHRPNQLSGGQQQRVAIARSLINGPRIIFADEPTGNLDSSSEKEIMDILHRLNDQGITVIMVTHEDSIGEQAKRVIRMRDGLIVSDQRLKEIQSKTTEILQPTQFTKTVLIQDIVEHFKQGMKTLLANKVRTALSMLGILIGVAAVVAMLALGAGAQQAIKDQMSTLGSNLLMLRAGAIRMGGVSQESGATAKLILEDADALKQQIPGAKKICSIVTGRGQTTYQNKNWNTQITGTTPSYAEMKSYTPDIGRFFTEEENLKRERVAVIGRTVSKELFGEQNPVGEIIKINKVSFQVIGVTPEKGSNGFRDQDDVIIIPLHTAMKRLLGKEYIDSFEIEMAENTDLNQAQDDILELMYSRKKIAYSQRDDAFTIRNFADIQASLSESNKTMSTLLAVIATISLIVGGIGIMNIMLVSVTERTKEIGLRKAIGAKKQDIMLQFLAESVVISVSGGLAGILLAWIITAALTLMTQWRTSISLESVLVSFLFSSFIGVIFGLYPAKKASELNPIEALRYE